MSGGGSAATAVTPRRRPRPADSPSPKVRPRGTVAAEAADPAAALAAAIAATRRTAAAATAAAEATATFDATATAEEVVPPWRQSPAAATAEPGVAEHHPKARFTGGLHRPEGPPAVSSARRYLDDNYSSNTRPSAFGWYVSQPHHGPRPTQSWRTTDRSSSSPDRPNPQSARL